MSSCPCALLTLKPLPNFNIALSLKQYEESTTFPTYCDELGIVLLLTRGVDFEAKKL